MAARLNAFLLAEISQIFFVRNDMCDRIVAW